VRGEVKRIPPRLRSFAQRLRGGQTDAEQKLWMRLRDRRIKEWKFRRQHPIGGCIVDFCCLEGMLIIELDGGQHLEQQDGDEERTKYLNSVGFRVLRFWNDDVLTKTDVVLEEILRALDDSESPHPHPHPSPLPHRERGSELRLRMPAEWERHEATWVGWPHNTTDWPGKMSAIQWVYGEIVRHLSQSELVRILVNNKAHEVKARRVLDRVGVDMSCVEYVRIPTNRGWTRDCGPMFLMHDDPQSQISIARFQFNAWAHYSDWHKDNRISERVASKFHIPLVPVTQNNCPVVLEGGSIDVNGQGTLLTTEECLLDDEVQVRNPGFSRQDYEEIFRTYFGISQVLWLGKGIAGDDTHGHVDDVCRFVDPYTVVLCQETNSSDENYRPLSENRERLEDMRCEDGRKVGIVPLPMPSPLFFDGHRLPASYANFYISNSVVVVPTFNDPNDRVALGILSELFSDRTVVGLHAVDLVWGFGTIHCLTQQQPAT